MGEGRWVVVRADGGGKALQLLRQELAEQDLATQEMPGDAIAVGLMGGRPTAATVVGVLKDWIHRRKSPEQVILTIEADSCEVTRGTAEERIQAFLEGNV